MSSAHPSHPRAQALLHLIRRWRWPMALAAGACLAGAVTLGVIDVKSPADGVPMAAPRIGNEVASASAPASEPASEPASNLIAPAAASVAQSESGTAAALSGLVLYGTVARDDPTTGYALLGTTAQNASLYGSGVEVAPGVLLREIYSDRVVLAQNGVLRVLPIAIFSGGKAQPGVETARLEETPPPPASADTLRAGAPDDERMPGIRVFPGRNRGAFAQLGLHPGDLVTAINGQPVTGPDVIDLQQMLKDLGTATVTVFRAGRLQQLSVQSAEAVDGSDADGDEP
jgi:general secretion pathway protein C